MSWDSFLLQLVGGAAPSDIALSANSVEENLPIGALIGTLASTDADAPESFSYELVPGAGSDDNSAFSISGNVISSTSSFNFESRPSYSIRVRSPPDLIAGGSLHSGQAGIGANWQRVRISTSVGAQLSGCQL